MKKVLINMLKLIMKSFVSKLAEREKEKEKRERERRRERERKRKKREREREEKESEKEEGKKREKKEERKRERKERKKRNHNPILLCRILVSHLSKVMSFLSLFPEILSLPPSLLPYIIFYDSREMSCFIVV